MLWLAFPSNYPSKFITLFWICPRIKRYFFFFFLLIPFSFFIFHFIVFHLLDDFTYGLIVGLLMIIPTVPIIRRISVRIGKKWTWVIGCVILYGFCFVIIHLFIFISFSKKKNIIYLMRRILS